MKSSSWSIESIESIVKLQEQIAKSEELLWSKIQRKGNIPAKFNHSRKLEIMKQKNCMGQIATVLASRCTRGYETSHQSRFVAVHHVTIHKVTDSTFRKVVLMHEARYTHARSVPGLEWLNLYWVCAFDWNSGSRLFEKHSQSSQAFAIMHTRQNVERLQTIIQSKAKTFASKHTKQDGQ